MAVFYAMIRTVGMLMQLNTSDYHQIMAGAAATFGRVLIALVIGSLWTIPVGVAIGFNPKLARIAQPLAQIAASVPATALFPIVLLLLIRIGGGLGIGSVVLLLLGTQWYILFNVIAGAMAIPTDLKEASSLFQVQSSPALAQAHSARHLSLSRHRIGYRIGWRVECQHRRRIFPPERSNLYDSWIGCDHLAGHRLRQLRPAAGLDHRYGAGCRHGESTGLAQNVPAGRRPIHSGNVGPEFA